MLNIKIFTKLVSNLHELKTLNKRVYVGINYMFTIFIFGGKTVVRDLLVTVGGVEYT